MPRPSDVWDSLKTEAPPQPVEFCTGETTCCEGEPGYICPACGKLVPPTPQVVVHEAKTTRPVGSLSDRLKQSANTEAHLVIIARAGTGKTTTLVEGLKLVKGMRSDFTPSPQQAEIWAAMESSRNARSICFCAFNRDIADELAVRVPAGCSAMTMHTMGKRAVQQTYGRVDVDGDRSIKILADLKGMDVRTLWARCPALARGVRDLVGMVKINLMSDYDAEDLDDIATYYDIDLEGSASEVFDLVPKVVERCLDVTHDRMIDFNDMIWLPVVHKLALSRYDLLLIDEAQDLNLCQQALARRAGSRLIFCGDPRQAIYGFAGADADSIPRMIQQLSSESVGCKTLPLTVTRRCGKLIVKEAQKYVSDFTAHESNPIGFVYRRDMRDYINHVRNGDMVICRVNSPLVSQCFKSVRSGRRANIQGKKIGDGLIGAVKKLGATDIVDLIGKLEKWHDEERAKELARERPREHKLDNLQERHDCILAFTNADGVSTVDGVLSAINRVFTDDASEDCINLSSIHKAKGLEAPGVHILQPPGATMPHPRATASHQLMQEYNLLYVGITRAIERLTYVQ